MSFGVISLLANQVKNLKNLEVLDFKATNHIYNSRDAFINFCLMKKKIYTATKKRLFFTVKEILL